MACTVNKKAFCAPAGLFVLQRTGSHSAGISCTTQRIVLSVGGFVRYMVRNLCCTVTIDSGLANSKTQNAFLFTVYAIFRHNYPLAVEAASTPRLLVQKKIFERFSTYWYAPFCLTFGKFQDTERFLIHCVRHFSSQLPPSGGTCKYAKAPNTKKTLRDSLPIDMLLSAVSVLVVAQSSSEIPEGPMNNPVYEWLKTILQSNC